MKVERFEPPGYWKDGWFVVPYQVIFRDLDAFGHVNNAVFFTYFEWGRARIWFEIAGGESPGDIGFIVARAECDFRKQLGMEPVDIASRIGEIRNSSFDVLSEIRNRAGEVVAEGRVVVVLWDWARQSKVPVSDELRKRIAECGSVSP